MTTQQTQAPERRSIEELSSSFAEVFRTLDVDDVFSPDVFFDMNVPVWRFQLEGVEAFDAWLHDLTTEGFEIEVRRTVPTASGFVTEHDGSQTKDGRELTFRHLWLCEVSDGRIVEVVGYCSGEWDEELRARHAAEAPMIRP